MSSRATRSGDSGRAVRALTFALLVGLSACDGHPKLPAAEALPTMDVAVQTVRRQLHQASEEVVGTVRAKVHTTIEAKVAGRITQMPATLGQRVRPGQLLVRLDVQEINATVSQARAVQAQAAADLRRFSALLKQQAVTQQEYDAAQARQRVARASVQGARTMLSYASIKAPFGGMVTRKLAAVGDQAAPGKPLLEIEDPSDLRLEVGVPEALIGRVKAGAMIPVRLAGIDDALEGKVSEVSPAADPNSRTFLVKVDLPERAEIRSGQFGRAVFPTAETTILRVPRAAVVVRGQLEIVFAVEQGKAQMRLVKTGKPFGTEIEIVAGLETGELVVVEGARRLRDGQPVRAVGADKGGKRREKEGQR